MKRLLKGIRRLYTCDDRERTLDQAYIVTVHDRIAELGSGAEPAGDFDEVVDLDGCMVVPGFVNVHHHFFQSLTRAIPGVQRGHLLTWLELLYPIWGRMQPDDLAAATEAACAELLLTGATTSSDHCYLVPHASSEYVDAEVAAARRVGIRLNLVRGSMTILEGDLEARLEPQLGPRAGGILDNEQDVLADMRRLLDRHHDPRAGSWTTAAVGPSTTTYESLGFMREIARMAGEAGCGLHTHFHPRPDERETCARLFGKKAPIEVLAEVDWLRPGTWFAHSTRLDELDIRKIAEAGCAIAHCPRMILRLGARLTPLHLYRAAGIRIGIGVDGAASNDCGSMIDEMRIALLLHRLAGGEGTVPHSEWLTPYDVLIMATRDGAKILGRDDIGQIAPGKCADLAAFDLRSVGYAGACLDPLSGLLLAGSDSRTALTMTGGEIRVRDGRLTGQDERQIRSRMDRSSARLIEEAARVTGVDYAAFPDVSRPQ